MIKHTLIQKNANWIKVPDPISMEIIAQKILGWKELVPGEDGLIPITKTILDRRRNAFPTGLLKYVTQALQEMGDIVDYQSIDFPRIPLKIINYDLNKVVYEPYQKEMLKSIGIIHKRGVLVAPTGAGKSILIGGIIQKLNVPYKTMIIVPTVDILKQIRTNMVDWFGFSKIGQIGDKVSKMGHITIALYQILSDCTFYKNEIKLLIVDEVHRINESIINMIKKYGINIHYRYGLTATPQLIENNPEKTFKMIGYIGPIVKKVEDEQVQSRVIPAKIYMVRFKNTAPIGENYKKAYKHDILLNEQRNTLFIKAIKKLAISKGKTALILLDEIEQLKQMQKIATKFNINVEVAHGKQNKMLNEMAKNKLNNKKIELVIATQVFGMGTNIPTVDCVALASARKSEIDTLQKIGRGRRKTNLKEELIVIDSIDHIRSIKRYHKYFYTYSLERMKIYREKGWEINRILIL